MSLSKISGDLTVTGQISCGAFFAPASSVNNAAVVSNAAIDYTKTQTQFGIRYDQAAGGAVVSETRGLYIAHNTGGIVDFQAAIIGAVATGADRTVTIDVKKSTGLAAPATVLSAPVVFNNASTLYAVTTASIAGGTFIAGDLIEVVVTVAGAAGAQAQGLLCTLTLWENTA